MKPAIRTFALTLTLAACATPASVQTASTETVVEEEEAPPSKKELFETMVHEHVRRRGPEVEQCYLSEVLSGNAQGLASFDLTIRARPGTAQPVVRVVQTSAPGQQMLATCVTNALTTARFPRETFDVFAVPVHVAAPEWVAAAGSE